MASDHTTPTDPELARRLRWLEQLSFDPRSSNVVQLEPPWSKRHGTRAPRAHSHGYALRICLLLAAAAVLALLLGAVANTLAPQRNAAVIQSPH